MLSRWPIKRALPALVAVLLGLSVLAGVSLALGFQKVRGAQERVHVLEKVDGGAARFAFLDLRMKYLGQLLEGLPAQAGVLGPLLQKDGAEIGGLVTSMTAADLSPEEHKAIGAMTAAFKDYSDFTATVRTSPPTTPADVTRVSGEFQRLDGAQAAATAAAQGVLNKSLSRQQAALRGAVSQIIAFTASLVAAAILLGLALLTFSRQLVRRLGGLNTTIAKVATGDLTVSADAQGGDEVASIGDSLNVMTSRLRQLMSAVGQSSARLDGTARELEDVAARVGRSAEHATRTADVAARAADEVSQSVEAVSAGSKEMDFSISEIARNATEAAQVATGAVRAVESTTAKMGQLGESSREIGDVVRLITTIAEQTNLLALNATIEAARAGDSGRGFAVVADEVKQLAQETARATDDISRRVEAIQADAEEATRAISDIADVIGRINEFQTTIASAVEEQTATTRVIKDGVGEAAAGSGRIADNITTVARATGETATTVDAAHANARELAAMSSELLQLVSGFRY